MKQLPHVSAEDIQRAFDHPDLTVLTTAAELRAHLDDQDWENTSLLLMSSGTFDGLDTTELSRNILN